jgi:hypothetical protein
VKITLDNVRLRYANGLFTPSKYTGPGADPTAKDKFAAKFIIERGDENYKRMVAALQSEAEREFGAAAEETLKAIKSLGMVWCLVDGDAKEDPATNGKLVVDAKNVIRPLLCDNVMDPATQVARVLTGTAAQERIYSGCYVNAIIDVKIGSKPQKQAYAYLLGVQFAKDGDRLGGVVAAADDFAAIPVPPPTGGNSGSSGAAALF